MSSSLMSRNITVGGHRTSMRLEPEMWDALFEICRRERLTPHDVCTRVEARRHASSLTAALRVFIMDYFRTASTEDGHVRAGHGAGLLGQVEAPNMARGDCEAQRAAITREAV
jgi:predicted DNA-binding ribbon-helix-helix protein